MTGLKETIQRDKKKLEWFYSKANTKSKRKRILRDLSYFSYLCQDCFGINEEFSWDNDEKLSKLLEKTSFPFIEHTFQNKEFFSNIMKNIIIIFQDLNFQFYDAYYKPYSHITESEFQEIIFDFLNEYDPKLLKKAQERMDNLEIISGRTKNYSGFSFPIYSLNKNYLLYPPSRENNIITASILVHEIGHSYESDILKECVNFNDIDNIDKAPYYEVVSNFFEYSFLNYLKENKIYIQDTKRAIDSYYMELLINVFNVLILYEMKNINLDKYGEVKIDDEEIFKYGEEIKEKLNCYFLSAELGVKINYRDSFVYAIGNILGVYLYEHYKSDPINFKKEFKNSIVNYSYNYIDSFEKVGLTREELLSGKILKKVLKETVIK